jgi:hypothetical protein
MWFLLRSMPQKISEIQAGSELSKHLDKHIEPSAD